MKTLKLLIKTSFFNKINNFLWFDIIKYIFNRRSNKWEWEAWGGQLGVLVRNLRTMKVVYWVNGSESSGAGSPGWVVKDKEPMIKGLLCYLQYGKLISRQIARGNGEPLAVHVTR